VAVRNNFPKLHNAMWPGLVGKGADSEPPIGLDEMIELTAAAEVEGMKFEGIDLFLADPHTSIDASRDDIEALADKIAAKNLAVGSLVAPVWPPVGGGSAMGSAADRERFSRWSGRRAGSASNCAIAASGKAAWFGSTRRRASRTGPRIPWATQR